MERYVRAPLRIEADESFQARRVDDVETGPTPERAGLPVLGRTYGVP